MIKDIAFVIACIVILIWVWKTMNWVYFEPKKLEKALRKQGLKGNSYKFLFGDIKELYKMRDEARKKPIPFTNDCIPRISPFIQQQINKYGNIFYTWSGPIPVIHIAEPELVKDAYNRYQEFQKAKVNPLIDMLSTGLASYEGEKWANHRKITNPAFHMEKIKLMLPAFAASAKEMISKWDTIVSKTGSFEVDVQPYLTSMAADAISRAAFGSNYEDGKRIFTNLTEQTHLTMRFFQSVYIPGWRFVPTKNNKRMKELESEIRKILTKRIDERKKAMETGEVAKDDLLGLLLDSNLKASQSVTSHKKQLAMSFDDMIGECKLFYFAGQETTSVLLVWSMILLSKHQDWQARAREEVVATFGDKQPHFDGLSQLKIATMIFYEVLRLYPPVVAIFRRIHERETKLGNLSIPRGAMLGFSIIHAQHDPRFWGDDANEFKPERFSEGIAKASKAYFPFGWGPRICLGQNFSMVEGKMALSMILQRFSFELSPSYTHAPTGLITLQPQHGAHLILHRL